MGKVASVVVTGTEVKMMMVRSTGRVKMRKRNTDLKRGKDSRLQ